MLTRILMMTNIRLFQSEMTNSHNVCRLRQIDSTSVRQNNQTATVGVSQRGIWCA